MSYLIPESALRLQATAFAHDAELSRTGRGEIIRMHAQDLSEKAVRKIMDDCVRIETFEGYQGQTLTLDMYVLSPAEIHKMLAEARKAGEQDALYWTRFGDKQ